MTKINFFLEKKCWWKLNFQYYRSFNPDNAIKIFENWTLEHRKCSNFNPENAIKHVILLENVENPSFENLKIKCTIDNEIKT